jgi:hypothetical protein
MRRTHAIFCCSKPASVRRLSAKLGRLAGRQVVLQCVPRARGIQQVGSRACACLLFAQLEAQTELACAQAARLRRQSQCPLRAISGESVVSGCRVRSGHSRRQAGSCACLQKAIGT